MAWVNVVIGGSTLIGAGLSAYGANKQSQATRDANNANIAAEQESERQNWLRYLMTRGITPDPTTRNGEIPGAVPGGSINTKLPLWAKVVSPVRGAPATSTPFLIKKG